MVPAMAVGGATEPWQVSITHPPLTVDEVPLPPSARHGPMASRILRAAVVRFADVGYHAATTREIAELVGVRSPSLYSHFASKEQILAELIELAYGYHSGQLHDAVLDASPSATEQLRMVVEAHVRVHCHYWAIALVADRELRVLPPERIAAAMAIRSQSEHLLHGVLRRGIERGEFDVTDPVLAMVAIAGMGIRVASWAAAMPSGMAATVPSTYADFALRIAGASR